MDCFKVCLKQGANIENADVIYSKTFPGFIEIYKKDGTREIINANDVS